MAVMVTGYAVRLCVRESSNGWLLAWIFMNER